MPKGSGRRKGAQMQDVLGELVSRLEERGSERVKGARDPRTELAESFRRASKSLEAATRDVVALRKRVSAKTPR